MIPQRVPDFSDGIDVFCQWLGKWGLSHALGTAIRLMQSNLPWPLTILSGRRTEEEQDSLRAEGLPTAPNHLSTHLSCPVATGADLSMGITPDNGVKLAFGLAAVQAGLRWGGGSRVDPDTGIPSDWNHVDLGPRIPG